MTSVTGATTSLDLPARAKVVAAIADQHATAGDQQGQLAAALVDAFHDEGLFGMWVPRSLRGGAELGPIPSLQVIESVWYGDPSAGWVLMASALAIGTGAAYLGDAAVAELFGGDRLPVIAGQGTRPGTAVPGAGGFSLSGSWSFASGIKHATHIHTLGVVEATGDTRIFVLPVGKATLVENWDVLGLRATGSIDYRAENVFVLEDYTHEAAAQWSPRGGALYTIGIAGFAVLCHSAWACGVGRRLLDELVTKVRSGLGRSGAVANSEAFHEQYAKAEAKYRAARSRLRGMGQRDRGARPRRAIVREAAHDDTARIGECDLVMPGGCLVCIPRCGNRGTARWDAAAAVPRHACRHAPHYVCAASHPECRPRTRRSGRSQEMAVSRFGRRVIANSPRLDSPRSSVPR